jgi:hypothetical protein
VAPEKVAGSRDGRTAGGPGREAVSPAAPGTRRAARWPADYSGLIQSSWPSRHSAALDTLTRARGHPVPGQLGDLIESERPVRRGVN